jgi:hypothetical protein
MSTETLMPMHVTCVCTNDNHFTAGDPNVSDSIIDIEWFQRGWYNRCVKDTDNSIIATPCHPFAIGGDINRSNNGLALDFRNRVNDHRHDC